MMDTISTVDLIKDDNEYGFIWLLVQNEKVLDYKRERFVNNNVNADCSISSYQDDVNRYLLSSKCEDKVHSFLNRMIDTPMIRVSDGSYSKTKILVRPDEISLFLNFDFQKKLGIDLSEFYKCDLNEQIKIITDMSAPIHLQLSYTRFSSVLDWEYYVGESDW